MSERWEIKKDFRFEAAHRLPLHDGKCQKLHGHSFFGTLTIGGDKLVASGPKSGMLLDYKDMSAVLKPLVERHLDHCYLNESTGLENPTSEEIARWVYQQIKLVAPELPIICVAINETCTSECVYYPA